MTPGTRGGALVALLAAVAARPETTPGPGNPLPFTDATADSGIDFVHAQSPTTQKYLIETMGGGVALLDADGDGRLDVFFTNGAELSDPMPAGARPAKSSDRFANRLYLNQGGLRFTDATERARLAGEGYSTGVAAADYDNDGDTDLYVAGLGGNHLYRNDAGAFTDVVGAAGAAGGGWSTSAAFLDYDQDGWLDLFVCRYVDFRFEANPYCGDRRPGYREYCHPRSFPGVASLLFRNRRDGTFQDVSAEAGIARHVGKALGAAIADYDDDGRIDVYVANDSVPAFLFHNAGQGRFTETALAAGAAVNEDGRAVAGMGVDFADVDNDLRADVVVTTLSGETYPLFHNLGSAFVDVGAASGLAAASVSWSGWGARLADFDNDGWKDFFAAQGHVLDTIELTSDHLVYAQPPLLLRGQADRLAAVPAAAGGPLRRRWAGRGAAFGDLDDDGDVDVVVSNLGQPAYVLRNDSPPNNWIRLELVGSRSNRDGIGARVVTITPAGLRQLHTVSTASSYQSASDRRLLIGLGGDDRATRIEVRWPSGATQVAEAVPAGRRLVLREPPP
jgi:hypothetical protein